MTFAHNPFPGYLEWPTAAAVGRRVSGEEGTLDWLGATVRVIDDNMYAYTFVYLPPFRRVFGPLDFPQPILVLLDSPWGKLPATDVHFIK